MHPGRFGDGRGGYGLSLLVRPTTVPGRLSKTWNQRLIINGKPRSIGLGSYPVVELDEAREQALLNKRALAKGEDPRRKVSDVPTFREAAEKVVEIYKPTWKGPASLRDWKGNMDNYAFPVLGDVPVSQITTSHVLDVLVPIWTEKRVTAQKVKSRIGMVLKWSIAEGHRPDNPAGESLDAALPKQERKPVQHRKSLPYAEVEAALETIREARDATNLPATLGMRILTLTAVRPGEVQGMKWSEVDLEAATWTLPAERMKRNKEFRVPLSRQAVNVLKAAKKAIPGGEYVFSLSGQPLDDRVFQRLVKKLAIAATPHGFRSSFTEWATERSDMEKEVIQVCISHKAIDDRVWLAYMRSDRFEKRRELMQQWADFVAPKG